jgi:L-lactate dehydrogenase (cytochrome)
MRDHLNWTHLEQIRRQWRGRLVVKGIMDPEDAASRAESGVDGHCLEPWRAPARRHALALRMLPGVVAAAGGMPVMMTAASGGARTC